MNCPGSEKLAGFADRTIPASERDAFEAHLVVCEKCRAEILSIVEAVEGEDTAPAGMADRGFKSYADFCNTCRKYPTSIS